jgi:putative SOS response-associated peptidase YedK
MFRNALRSQCCLVPASGFYEWQQTATGKQPYWIRLRGGQLFAFAGLWESWHDRHGGEVRSYTIITTAPNELMAPIHNRMPMILRREDEELWLNPDETEGERLSRLLRAQVAPLIIRHALVMGSRCPGVNPFWARGHTERYSLG